MFVNDARRDERMCAVKVWKGFLVGVLAFVLVVGVVACGDGEPAEETNGSDDEVMETTETAAYIEDIGEGKVKVVGVLMYSDLEGGTWAIVDNSMSPAENLAVISNYRTIESQLKELEGKNVIAEGELNEGASIRMAGPEMTVDSIEQAPAK